MTTLKNYKYNKQMYLQIGGVGECKINNGHIFHNGDYCGNTLEKAPEKSTFYECGKKSEEKKEDGSNAYMCWPTIMIICNLLINDIPDDSSKYNIKNIPNYNTEYKYYINYVLKYNTRDKKTGDMIETNTVFMFDPKMNKYTFLGTAPHDIKYDYIICRNKNITQTQYDGLKLKLKNNDITTYTYNQAGDTLTPDTIKFNDNKTSSMFLLHCSNKSSKKLVVVSDDITDAKLVVLKSTSEVKKINELDEKQQYDEITFSNIYYITIINIKKLINMLTSNGKIIITIQNYNLGFVDTVYGDKILLLTTTNIKNNSSKVIDESDKAFYSTIDGIIGRNNKQLDSENIIYTVLSPNIIINKQVL